MISFPSRIFLLACLTFPLIPAVFADDPLAAKTLIVYVSNSPDSIAVKDHYVAARFTNPATAKVCPITLPDVTAVTLNETDYLNSVRNPVRNCLSNIRAGNVLYIVLAYMRPYRIQIPRGLQNYALDSYLADMWNVYTTTDFNPYPSVTQRYYADSQNQGDYYLPFQTFDNFRANKKNGTFYSVWRLDGPTPAIANAMVDKATAAMNHATGAACFDRNQGNPVSAHGDFLYATGDWDLYKAGQFLSQAGVPVVDDAKPAVPSTWNTTIVAHSPRATR